MKINSSRFFRFLSLTCIALFAFSALSEDLSHRTWTRKDGKTAEGKLLEVNGKIAFIRMADEKLGELKISELSLTDQQYVKDWAPNPPEKPDFVSENAWFQSGKWFGIVYEKLTWKEAEKKAREMGGQLAQFDSELERELLDYLWKDKHYFWIGATDEAKEGEWKWIDGTPVKFSHWDAGQPSNGNGTEHYAAIRPGGKWNDVRVDSPSITGYLVTWEHPD